MADLPWVKACPGGAEEWGLLYWDLGRGPKTSEALDQELVMMMINQLESKSFFCFYFFK